MKHFDENTLLKFFLEVLDNSESQSVRNHLSECEICSSLLNDLKKQNKLIASYNPKIEDIIVSINKKNNYPIWLKRAAVLLIGFLLGYVTSIILQPERVVVVEQLLISKSLQLTSANFTPCPYVDIYRSGLEL